MRRYAWLIVLTASCAAPPEVSSPIRIFAAASLTDALAAAADAFEAEHPGVAIVAQFGSSSDLARQILAGAPADLFFSADRRQLDRLIAREAIVSETDVDVLSNSLVLVGRRDAGLKINHAQELSSLTRVAMADPEAVPAGVYAREYLESLGLWGELSGKIVPTLDVRGALAAVASGNVEAGFVYRTDAALDGRVQVIFAVPQNDGPVIRYSLGIASGRDTPDVRSFYEFLGSDEAAAIFARFGFIELSNEAFH